MTHRTKKGNMFFLDDKWKRSTSSLLSTNSQNQNSGSREQHWIFLIKDDKGFSLDSNRWTHIDLSSRTLSETAKFLATNSSGIFVGEDAARKILSPSAFGVTLAKGTITTKTLQKIFDWWTCDQRSSNVFRSFVGDQVYLPGAKKRIASAHPLRNDKIWGPTRSCGRTNTHQPPTASEDQTQSTTNQPTN